MPFEPPQSPPPAAPAPSAAGGTVVEGRRGVTSEAKRALKLPTNPDFYLMHHPNGWRLEKTERGWEVLPVLKDLVCIGGTNGVEITEAGPNTANARAKLQDAGWTILMNQDDYRRIYDVAGGVAHRLLWDRITAYSDGDFDLAFDEAGYQDFRRALVTGGVLKAPRPRVVEALRNRLERRIGRRAGSLHIPARAAAQERDEDRLDGLAEALRPAAAPNQAGTP